MSFENYKYSVDKDPYDWCLRQSKQLKTIDPKMNIQMRNHKLLTQMPGELENAVKFRGNQICTLDEVANTLQDIRKRKNIGKITNLEAVASKSITDGGTVTYNTRKRSRKLKLDLVSFSAQL
ncbi:hypothetical protein O181_026165 [Austropuccinia psidii MF-1]|uniref:Uncharacterized protein n=1 Tax=Austropuccinia psidii MF-1 TaxID=1389203 RepID=A0A9Q3CNX2_9BASI|nr:hypothetical protein [Austropuccinia psidii MF-1]